MSSITVTYTLQPPSGIETSVPKTDTLCFESGPNDSTALRIAQAKLNEVLTVWKDAIGDVEKAKEDPGKIAYGQGKIARMMQSYEDSDDSDS
jgi:hypothetical protein